jgi:hypothetical protein
MRRLTPFAARFDMSSVSPGTTDVDDKYLRQAQVDDFGSAGISGARRKAE